MVKRVEKNTPARTGSVSSQTVTFTIEGTPLEISIHKNGDSSGQVSLEVIGLSHPDLEPDEAGYIGRGTKDPRLEPLATAFVAKVLDKLGLEQKPITAGFPKKTITVQPGELEHIGDNRIRTIINLKYPDGAACYARKDEVMDRLDKAISAAAPELERDAKKALKDPMPALMPGETAASVVARRSQQALSEMEVEAELAKKLEAKHHLPPGEALKVAITAVEHLREQGLLKPQGRGLGGGSNN